MIRKALIFAMSFFAVSVVSADTFTTRFNLCKPSLNSPAWGPKEWSNWDIEDGNMAGLGIPNVFSSTETFLGPVSFSQVVQATATYSLASSTANYANTAGACPSCVGGVVVPSTFTWSLPYGFTASTGSFSGLVKISTVAVYRITSQNSGDNLDISPAAGSALPFNPGGDLFLHSGYYGAGDGFVGGMYIYKGGAAFESPPGTGGTMILYDPNGFDENYGNVYLTGGENNKTFLTAASVNVGTNTALSSTATLAVNGSISSSSGGYKFPDGSWQGTAAVPQSVKREITLTVDGANAVIATGKKDLGVRVPSNMTLTGWELKSYPQTSAGTLTVDVWYSAFGSFPTQSNTIVGSSTPTLTSGYISSGTCSGWTTALSEGGSIDLNFQTVAVSTRAVVTLFGTTP